MSMQRQWPPNKHAVVTQRVSPPLGVRSDFEDVEDVMTSLKGDVPSHGYEVEPIDVEEDNQ